MSSRALRRLTRRELIRAGLIVGGASVAASALEVPTLLERAVYAAAMENVRTDVTIGLVQLAGGQDGLNTVIPMTAGLEGMRPGFGDTIIQAALNAGTGLNADFAFHPSLKNLARRFQQGQVAVLMDLGYPMPSRSHEQATQIWQTGDTVNRELTGVFGRLTPFIDAKGHPFGLSSMGSASMPGILRGSGRPAVLPANPTTFAFKGGVEPALATLWEPGVPGVYGQALTDAMADARSTAAGLRGPVTGYRPQGAYDGAARTTAYLSQNELARSLEVAAALIKGGAAPTVFHTTFEGWDTHQDEQNRQTRLLALLDQAVEAFLVDCAAAGRFPTLATWSEFGRTVRINDSGGTDHGGASTMLVMGQNVRGGIYGTRPDLGGYDVPMQADFRSMYATLIDHLGVDPTAVVGGDFKPIQFMATVPATRGTPAPTAPSPAPASPPTASPTPAAPTPSPAPASPAPASPAPTPTVSPSPSPVPGSPPPIKP